MRCTLMHKRIPVVELELDDATGFINGLYEVYAPEHFPLDMKSWYPLLNGLYLKS